MGVIRSFASNASQAERRAGLRACALGWHRRPLEMVPCPRGVPKGTYLLHPRYRCGRCGLAGRMDCHGNLDELDEDPYAPGPG